MKEYYAWLLVLHNMGINIKCKGQANMTTWNCFVMETVLLILQVAPSSSRFLATSTVAFVHSLPAFPRPTFDGGPLSLRFPDLFIS